MTRPTLSAFKPYTHTGAEAMTDDEILVAAERIKLRRKNEARLASFERAPTVTIRWDVPGAPFGESYVGVTVPNQEVADVVRRHYATKEPKP